MTDIRFTAKQIEVLDIIKSRNPDNSYCSVYDIIEKLSYPCKRDALLHVLKNLVDKGYVERRSMELRDSRAVRVFGITTKALDYV